MYQSNNQGGHVNAGREAGAFGAAAHTTGTTHTANKTGNQAAAPVATPAAATGRRRFITPALKRKHDKNLITAHRERVIFHLKAGGEFAMLGSDKSLNISILPPPHHHQQPQSESAQTPITAGGQYTDRWALIEIPLEVNRQWCKGMFRAALHHNGEATGIEAVFVEFEKEFIVFDFAIFQQLARVNLPYSRVVPIETATV